MTTRVEVPYSFPCGGCGKPHKAIGYTTDTPGLVVGAVPICPTRPTPPGWEGVTLTHVLTGRRIEGPYPDTDTALAVAAALKGIADWTQPPPYSPEIRAAATAAIRATYQPTMGDGT